ncbi:MAG: ABC transporter ATP-binding protein/permease [Eubacterium sp.]|nr:ABC transporter ATP-binding protein/permease [Eubacterium sp.]
MSEAQETKDEFARFERERAQRRKGPGPGPVFYSGEKPNYGKTTGRLLSYIRKGGYLPHMIVVFICLIVASLGSVAGTYLLRYLIDDYITPFIGMDNPDMSYLYTIIGMMIVAYACHAIGTWTYNRLMVSVCQGVLKKIRDDMFVHMEKLPLSYFDSKSKGDLMSRYTNDADTLRQFLSMGMTQIVSALITSVSIVVSMLTLSWHLTLLVFALLCLILFVSKIVVSKSAVYFGKQQASLGKVNGYVEEMITGQKVIKVFCREQTGKDEFDEMNDELFENASRANILVNILMPIMAQMGNLSYLVVAIVGAVLAVSGLAPITLGILASFLTFTKNLIMPITMVSQQLNSVVMALAGAERIFKLMDEEPEVDEGTVTLVNAKVAGDGTITETSERTEEWAWKKVDEDGSVQYRKLEGDVRFNDVDFAYVEGKPVLEGMELFAKPGQKIAFVGHTGAGKTTITNLINRFYDVTSGEILYDGINVNHIRKQDLRHSLGIVLQDTHLFSGTIRENIRYGRLDATDEEVVEAARLSNAHYFIEHLKDGYDTVIDNDGGNLSQGQCQLLAIARAAIADPPVLILDEATSSIDTRTEKVISEGMDKLMEGRTVFVIAHRLSTVRNANVILVLDNGKVVERGDHDELIAQRGMYYNLYTGATELG